MSFVRTLAAVTCLAAALGVAISPAIGCPFCLGGTGLTLAEQVSQSDAVVLVQWVEANEANEQSNGTTTYEIVEVARKDKSPSRDRAVKSPAVVREAADRLLAPAVDDVSPKVDAKATPRKPVTLRKGERLTLDRYRTGKPGDLFLLIGTQSDAAGSIEWGVPEAVTEAGYQYVVQAPSPEVDPIERLRYFVKFLEFPDDFVSNDAYQEFAKAPYEQITPLAKDLPREKIRRWLSDPQTPQVRLGLYGLMLGLCGNTDDVKLMEEKITANVDPSELRLGIDGIMAGYLLLTGEKGLAVLEQSKLQNRSTTFSETYGALQALQFMWSYTSGTIEKERMRASMRKVLERPELAEFAIRDLARWEDWSVQDRLMELYGTDGYDVPSVKTAIVCYMLVSTRQKPGNDEPAPARVAKGQAHLKALRERDPQTVARAEKVPL